MTVYQPVPIYPIYPEGHKPTFVEDMTVGFFSGRYYQAVHVEPEKGETYLKKMEERTLSGWLIVAKILAGLTLIYPAYRVYRLFKVAEIRAQEKYILVLPNVYAPYVIYTTQELAAKVLGAYERGVERSEILISSALQECASLRFNPHYSIIIGRGGYPYERALRATDKIPLRDREIVANIILESRFVEGAFDAAYKDFPPTADFKELPKILGSLRTYNLQSVQTHWNLLTEAFEGLEGVSVLADFKKWHEKAVSGASPYSEIERGSLSNDPRFGPLNAEVWSAELFELVAHLESPDGKEFLIKNYDKNKTSYENLCGIAKALKNVGVAFNKLKYVVDEKAEYRALLVRVPAQHREMFSAVDRASPAFQDGLKLLREATDQELSAILNQTSFNRPEEISAAFAQFKEARVRGVREHWERHAPFKESLQPNWKPLFDLLPRIHLAIAEGGTQEEILARFPSEIAIARTATSKLRSGNITAWTDFLDKTVDGLDRLDVQQRVKWGLTWLKPSDPVIGICETLYNNIPK